LLNQILKVLKITALIVFIASCPILIWALIVLRPPVSQPTPPTPADLIAVLFTGVTIILGVLAVVIAVFAIWGYQAIKKEALDSAERAAQKWLVDSVDGANLKDRIISEVEKRSATDADVILQGIMMGNAFPSTDSGEPEQAVGKKYPENEPAL
jgi:hypothetical protein